MPDKLLTDCLPLLLTEPVYIVAEHPAPTPPAEPSGVPPAAPAPPPPPRPVPAQPRSRVVVVYTNRQTVYLDPAEELLLGKILGAVKLRLDDVELVNVHNHRDDLVQVLRGKLVHQLISFGIELRDLDIQVPLEAYRVKRVEGIDILLADSLTELQINTEKKKMLWAALQHMFLLGQRK